MNQMKSKLMAQIEKIPIVKFEKIREDAFGLEKAHKTDSGYDIRTPKGLHLKPNEVQLIKTGIRIALPEGYECQVRSRSGLPVKYGIFFALGIGTIDEGYRGEIMVPMINFTDKQVHLPVGSKIAQLVFSKVDKVLIEEAHVSTDTERGEGGFGSTGL